jgi:hypothetical protein
MHKEIFGETTIYKYLEPDPNAPIIISKFSLKKKYEDNRHYILFHCCKTIEKNPEIKYIKVANKTNSSFIVLSQKKSPYSIPVLDYIKLPDVNYIFDLGISREEHYFYYNLSNKYKIDFVKEPDVNLAHILTNVEENEFKIEHLRTNKKKDIIYIIGAPGSGKSYLANKIRLEWGYKLVLSTDKLEEDINYVIVLRYANLTLHMAKEKRDFRIFKIDMLSINEELKIEFFDCYNATIKYLDKKNITCTAADFYKIIIDGPIEIIEFVPRRAIRDLRKEEFLVYRC